MKIKKDKGQLEYILCFLAIFLACILIIVFVNLSSYKMRKEHVENFVTDSTLAGAVIDIPRFQLTGHISNYDIQKAYDNFTICLKDNLNLGQETRQDGIITSFKGNPKDLVISNENEAVKITDFYLYNAEFENDDDDPGTFNVTKLIKDGQVYKNAKETIFAENVDYATITLSQSTGKNKKVKLDKNTLSVYVRLEIKIKSFGTSIWGNNYFTKTATGVHEYLVDVARNDIDYVDDKTHPDDEHSYVLTESIPPTCTTDGKNIYDCKCGNTYIEVVKSTGHTEIKEGKEEAHTRCSVCGIILSSEHEYTTSLIKESTCDEQGEVKYTCECGYYYIKYINKSNHIDIFGGKENIHTECSLCGKTLSTEHNMKEMIIKQPTCTEKGIIEYICECGYSYLEDIDMIEHEYRETKIDKITCDTEGGIQYTCNECEYTYIEITEEATPHDFNEEITFEPTCSEKGEKKLICKICEYECEEEIDLIEHEYDEIVIDATCVKEGYTSYSCINCGYNYTNNETPIDPNNHMEEYIGTKDIHSQCKYCNEILSTEHYFKYIITKEPTCTETGLEMYKCVCGYYEGEIETREVPANGHQNIIETIKEPTCTEKGQEKHICEICEYEEIVDVKEKGHDYTITGTIEIIKEPICTEKGQEKHICGVCDYEEIVDIDELGHNYIETEIIPSTCFDDGYTTYKCDRCDDIYTEYKKAPGQHIYSYNIILLEPTCTSTGIRELRCICGDNYEEIIPALKHDYTNGACKNCGYLPEKGRALNNYTWEEIDAISKANEAINYFSIGDEKSITIGTETYTAQIYGFNHDNLANGNGTAGITFGLKEIMNTRHCMNSTDTNIGGWVTSEMRTYVNNNVYDLLSDELRNVIKEVYKYSDRGNMNEVSITTTVDKLFIPSLEEVGGSENHYVYGQGLRYDFFESKTSRVKKYLKGYDASWWLRSAVSNNNTSFFDVDYDGTNYNCDATWTNGVAICFCV